MLSLGVVRGGTAPNVIPRSVHIEGTLRSMDPDVRIKLRRKPTLFWRRARVGRGLFADHRAGVPFAQQRRNGASVVTDTGRDLLGGAGLARPRRLMGAEDFSYVSNLVPSAFFFWRAHTRRRNPNPASPTFTIDEDLPIGAAMLAAAATRLLKID